MNFRLLKTTVLLVLLTSVLTFAQQPFQMVVQANKPKAAVQSTMWGIFFEDINFGADGGIYAELIKNRSFEFLSPLMAWKELKKDNNTGSVLITNRGDNLANPRFARVTINGSEAYGLQNEGFRGIGVKKDMLYHFSILAKRINGDVTIRVEVIDAGGKIIGNASLKPGDAEWKKYESTFTVSTQEMKARLNVWFEGKGIVDVDMISLFPDNTWKKRPNGLREDLVQLLYEMKPGFLRFPGGCIVEGKELANRYQWKKTIGKVEDRELIINRWNTEFSHRPAPDYFQSYGLGFLEYFQLAEDIGAEPLPILNCGMACQFNTAEVVPLDQLDPYIQDALDLIEFANGTSDTKWGKLRIELGHANPFNLKLLGVGNEQWGPQYVDRYKIFVKAIKDKYPTIKIVTSLGPSPDDDRFAYLNPTFRGMNADILDEHYYQKPEWFLKNANRYDNYDRKGPKIFAGEYAAQSVATVSPDNKNTWQCALAEAAFMTGLERNADVVYMASYAPLFAHAEGWQWTPDLIWFDNLRSYGTPNYYVQKLFSTNKGTTVLPLLHNGQAIEGENGLYASAVSDSKTKNIILKVANTVEKESSIELNIEGAILNGTATVVVLKADALDGTNSLDDPKGISPIEQKIKLSGKKLKYNLPANSFSVIQISSR